MLESLAHPKENAGPAEKPLRIKSEELMRGSREMLIVHNGREYRLRQTQNGKLILTA